MTEEKEAQMSRDKEALKKAWPKGYLAVQGLSTIGGFHFVAHDVIFSVHGSHAHDISPLTFCILYSPLGPRPKRLLEEGALLPHVEPNDSASWAILLRDLARGAKLKTRGRTIRFTMNEQVYSPTKWVLESSDNTGLVRERFFFEVSGQDPATALIQARTLLRKEP